MAIPVLYARNLLEGAILTMTPDGPMPGKGPERLIDRDIGLECEDSGTTGTRTWHVDRGVGAAADPVQAWIFIGSQYAGTVLTLATSPDNTAWTTRATHTPASDTAQHVALTPFPAPRYIRWTIASPAAPVRFTEVFLAVGNSFSLPPTARHTQEPLVPNVVLLSSQSGRAWGVQRGARRLTTRYTVEVATEADRTTLHALMDAIQDGVLPFWMTDHHGVLRWVRLSGDLVLQAAPGLPTDRWTMPLEFVDELP
jgi:hypothetical protein